MWPSCNEPIFGFVISFQSMYWVYWTWCPYNPNHNWRRKEVDSLPCICNFSSVETGNPYHHKSPKTIYLPNQIVWFGGKPLNLATLLPTHEWHKSNLLIWQLFIGNNSFHSDNTVFLWHKFVLQQFPFEITNNSKYDTTLKTCNLFQDRINNCNNWWHSNSPQHYYFSEVNNGTYLISCFIHIF